MNIITTQYSNILELNYSIRYMQIKDSQVFLNYKTIFTCVIIIASGMQSPRE